MRCLPSSERDAEGWQDPQTNPVCARGRSPVMSFPTLCGGAVLAGWLSVDAADEASFNHWYAHEHLPDRVGVPGFLRGRRYAAVGSAPTSRLRFFTLYEVQEMGTFTSPCYLDRRRNPTEWTRRTDQLIRSVTRKEYRVTHSSGQGTGGFLATLRFEPERRGMNALRRWISQTLIPRMLEDPRVLSVHLCEAAADGRSPSGEKAPESWLLMVEASHEAALEAANIMAYSDFPADLRGAGGAVIAEHFRLLASLSSGDRFPHEQVGYQPPRSEPCSQQ